MKTRLLTLCLFLISVVGAEEGKVFFRSIPSGADVYLGPNTKPSGKTPCLIPVALGNGKARLSLVDHTTKEVNFNVKNASILKLDVVKLSKDLFPVDIVFLEEGWQILVNKKPYLEDDGFVSAPATIQLGRGQHEVRLVKKGFRDIMRQVDAEKTKSVTVDTKPAVGISSYKENKQQTKPKSKSKFANFDFDNYTVEQWDSFKGPIVTVSARKELDTGILIKQGQKLAILPHPSDIWNWDSRLVSTSIYKGISSTVNNLPVVCLCYKFKANANAKIRKYGVTIGSGRLILFANDSNNMDNSGKIRVKLVPIKH